MADIIVTKEELLALVSQSEALTAKADAIAATLVEWSQRPPVESEGGGDTGGGPMSVDSISPTNAHPGDTITITGSGFGNETGTITSIGWNGTVSSWSNSRIVFVLPNTVAPGQQNIYINGVWLTLVLVEGGQDGNPPPPFTIGSVTPAPAHDGDLLTIHGTGFGEVAGSLQLGSTIQPLLVESWSDTAITFIFPQLMSGMYHVSVKLPDGRSLDSADFAIVPVDTGGGDTGGDGTTDLPAEAPPEPDPGSDNVSFAISSPVVTRATHRRFTMDPERPYYQWYSDWVPDDQHVQAGTAVPWAGQATPGLFRNAEVHAHGKRIGRKLLDSSGKIIDVVLDLSEEYNGPLKVEHYAWDSLPGNNYQNEAKQSHWWIIEGSIDRPRPSKPRGAAGLIEAFNYNFGHGPLSVSSTDKTKIWCPSKAEQKTATYDGHGQYGEAIFIDPAKVGQPGVRATPFYEVPNWLRIRAQFDHTAHDPMGWNRFITSGTLGLGRPGGDGGRYAHPPAYIDCEIYAPIGVTAWPALWMNSLQSLLDGQYNLEIDIVELLSNYPDNFRSGMIRYVPGQPVQYGEGAAVERGVAGWFATDHLNWEPHRWAAW